ncbi:hypothetical protein N7537_006298 [Penicillium hordei]|uniref:Uncharacterized protein n=1 Tax=Penicillium hordei TaxID=40994 RepID=A0AAD6H3Y5_9EURO|nr:uncharacterized protein N7537_006298 [Penicillium hordei]KAJ5603342.1 hypothetical protein N7537_006298 [Penicillium hordei]
MSAISSFQYSNGKVAAAETAKSFSWEAPVQLAVDPVGINPDDTADQQQKLQLLLLLLRNKLTKEEAAISPRSLYEVNYEKSNQL